MPQFLPAVPGGKAAGKPFQKVFRAVADEKLFCPVQGAPVHTFLEIMAKGQNNGCPQIQGPASVLKGLKEKRAGFQDCKQRYVKAPKTVGFRPVRIFALQKPYRNRREENLFGSGRTGERQGKFPQIWKFLRMPWIQPAGAAESQVFAALLVQFAQLLLA